MRRILSSLGAAAPDFAEAAGDPAPVETRPASPAASSATAHSLPSTPPAAGPSAPRQPIARRSAGSAASWAGSAETLVDAQVRAAMRGRATTPPAVARPASPVDDEFGPFQSNVGPATPPARDPVPDLAATARAALPEHRLTQLGRFERFVAQNRGVDLFPRSFDDPGRRQLIQHARQGNEMVVRFLLADRHAHGREQALAAAREGMQQNHRADGDPQRARRYNNIINALLEHQQTHGRGPMARLQDLARSRR